MSQRINNNTGTEQLHARFWKRPKQRKQIEDKDKKAREANQSKQPNPYLIADNNIPSVRPVEHKTD